MEEENSSDEEHDIQTFSTNIDLETFYKNYQDMKSRYITQPKLNKYEKTKIISDITATTCKWKYIIFKKKKKTKHIIVFKKIALEKIKTKKIPFIIERSNSKWY